MHVGAPGLPAYRARIRGRQGPVGPHLGLREVEADAAYYQANKEEMRRYDKAYAASHREERREAARRWQARFKAEHGISYSAWRRRRLRETDPQTAASTPQTAAPARNTGENRQAAADNSIRSVSTASAEPHGSGRRL